MFLPVLCYLLVTLIPEINQHAYVKLTFLGFFFAGPTNVEKRSANDFNDFVEDTKNSILGGICITDNDCSFISYCDKSDRKFLYLKDD